MIKWLALFAFTLITSWLLSRVVLHHLGKRLLDTPNNRSSHQSPTPRGGGIAIAASVLIAAFLATTMGYLDKSIWAWLIAPAILISLLGILDDFFNLSIKLRLAIQFILATTGILLLRTTQPSFSLLDYALLITMIFFVTWMTNLYNFMDGINGLAALELISVCTGMILIYTLLDTRESSIYLMLILAASVCGFLYWNFPNARLFMGDSGSLFLGFCLGLLALESANENLNLVAAWLIMLAVFVVDATYTLLYRIISGQAFSQAHKSHSYQKCAVKYQSHARVTLTIVAINILWLFPLALGTAINFLHPLIGLVIAYIPLLAIAKTFKAGRPS